MGMMKKAGGWLLAGGAVFLLVQTGMLQVAEFNKRRVSAERAAAPQGRLPAGVRPLAYRLNLRVDPDRPRFRGRVAIRVELDDATTEFWMHGRDLEVSDVELKNDAGHSSRGRWQEMGGSGVARVSFNEAVPAGAATLQMEFTAAFNESLAGLYRVVEEGRAYAFTQFEAIDARRAFPGFDEPGFKTPFHLVLEVKEEHRAFANTPVEREEPAGPGWRRLIFKPTPPLPTYLLAMAVGPLDLVEGPTIPAGEIPRPDIPLRGIAVHGRGPQLEYALHHTARTVQLLEEYFGLPYPYRKLDLVAVPDFRSGAMENAGLITYREPLLLFRGEPGLRRRQSFASVHAHELAHQWHGNLVTMPWWDDIWLNESFATWMARKVQNRLDPEPAMGRQGVRSAHRVMRRDSFRAVRRVREPVQDEHGIAHAFDGISYAKGGAVLDMFESWLGPDVFRRGVQEHVRRFAGGHATAEDFTASLAAAAGDDTIPAALSGFLHQPGVPLVSLSRSCSAAGTELRLEQRRDLHPGSGPPGDELWQIPVCLKLLHKDGEQRHCLLFSGRTQTSTIPGPCPQTLMPNAGGAGYYRFALEADDRRALVQSRERLTPAERYVLWQNLEAGWRRGDLSTAELLQAAGSFARDPARDVSLAPLPFLAMSGRHGLVPGGRPGLLRLARSLYGARLQQTGLAPRPGEPPGEKKLRAGIAAWLALEAGDTDLRKGLAARGAKLSGYHGPAQPDLLDDELIGAALTAAVLEYGRPFFDFLHRRFTGSGDAVFRRRALAALAAGEDPEQTALVQEMLLTGPVRMNEKSLLLRAIMDHPEDHHARFEWLKSIDETLRSSLPPSWLAWLPALTGDFCSAALEKDVADWFTERSSSLPGGERHLQAALERIRVCSRIVSRHREMAVRP